MRAAAATGKHISIEAKSNGSDTSLPSIIARTRCSYGIHSVNRERYSKTDWAFV
jgi:hypothetical protein